MEARVFYEIQIHDTRVRISCLAKSIKHPSFPWIVEVSCMVVVSKGSWVRRRKCWLWDYDCHHAPTRRQLKIDAEEHLWWFLSLVKDALEGKTDILDKILRRAGIFYAHDIEPTPNAFYSLAIAGEIASCIALVLDAILSSFRRSDDRKRLIEVLAVYKPNQKNFIGYSEEKEAMVYG
ncbi:hypothetical protein GG496_001504 [Candidatus Fervidibacteria bacterium JGI MDM2 JNZ-1-D12]